MWPQRETREHLCGIVRIAALAPDNIPFCLSKLLHGPVTLSLLGSASYFHTLKLFFTKKYTLRHLGYSRTPKILVNQPNLPGFQEEICHMHVFNVKCATVWYTFILSKWLLPGQSWTKIT